MRILLVRHAKSEHPAGVADHDRPLTVRGAADAVAVGRHLERLRLAPARILSSTAVRAAETARLIAEQLTSAPPVEQFAGLYGAGVSDLLTMAGSAGEDVMIVGHQPTLSMTLEALCGASVAMVTAAVACVEAAAARRGAGVLQWLLTPRLVPRDEA
jgi:phosphohistidine phosphatase